MPIDRPAEKGAVDDLHQNEGDGETGDEAEENPRGTEVGGLGHNGSKNLATRGAGGT